VDFDFEDPNLAVQVDAAIRGGKPHNWVGNVMKEKVVKRAVQRVLPDSFDRFDELFHLIKARHEYR
jgi:type I restriction enzyme R subunit